MTVHPARTQISSSPSTSPRTRRIRVAVVGGAATLAFTAAMLTPAFAAPGEISQGSTAANVDVTTSITLTGLTPNFTLAGIPGATDTAIANVTANVVTNNFAGYAVTVQSETPTLAPPGVPVNTDSIPIGLLQVRETDTIPFVALSDVAPVTVHSQDTRSAADGDALSNDYSITVPFVNEGTYTATLDYVATTL